MWTMQQMSDMRVAHTSRYSVGLTAYARGCRCGECIVIYRAWHNAYRATPRVKARRKVEHLRQKYGLTPQDVEDIICAQGGACAICQRTLVRTGLQTHVDHCHKTGVVRGVLCNRCNKGLGYFDDNPDAMIRASRYVGFGQSESARCGPCDKCLTVPS